MTAEHTPEPPRYSRRRRRRGGGCGCAGLLCLFATGLAVLYTVALVLLHRLGNEDSLPCYLAVYLPQPPLLLPLAASALLCVLMLQWRLLLANLVVAAAAVALLVPPALPGDVPLHDPRQRIRIVTWNVHEEFGEAERIRAALAPLKPDVVCLQEARRGMFYEVLPGAQVAHTHEVTTLTRGKILRSARAHRLAPAPPAAAAR